MSKVIYRKKPKRYQLRDYSHYPVAGYSFRWLAVLAAWVDNNLLGDNLYVVDTRDDSK